MSEELYESAHQSLTSTILDKLDDEIYGLKTI